MRRLCLCFLACVFALGCGPYTDIITPSETQSTTATPSPTMPTPTPDEDGDGFSADVDCDDQHDEIYPGAPEDCDRDDNDCDGITDEDPAEPDRYHVDNDGDGYPGMDVVVGCFKGTHSVYEGTDTYYDCNDRNPEVYPFAEEQCETLYDDDCDGKVSEDDLMLFEDADNDNWGINTDIKTGCEDLPYWSPFNGDCDDHDPLTNPGAEEICDNGKDNNCDQLVDYCPTHESVLVDESPALDYVTLYEDEQAFDIESCSGDIDGDGLTDLVMLRPGRKHPHGFAIYSNIFEGNQRDYGIDTDIETQDPEYVNARAANCDQDVDGDGVDDLLIRIVRTYYPDGTEPEDARLLGELYMFLGPIDSDLKLWEPDAVLSAPGLEANFGAQMVSVPGKGTLLVSAPGETETDPGRVYAFALPHNLSEPWAPETLFEHPDVQSFGSELAVLEGPPAFSPVDFLVGAPHEAFPACDGGAVYGFNLTGEAQAGPEAAVLAVESYFPGARSGTSIVLGDIDGSGLADLVIGAPAGAGAACDTDIRDPRHRGRASVLMDVDVGAVSLEDADYGTTGIYQNSRLGSSVAVLFSVTEETAVDSEEDLSLAPAMVAVGSPVDSYIDPETGQEFSGSGVVYLNRSLDRWAQPLLPADSEIRLITREQAELGSGLELITEPSTGDAMLWMRHAETWYESPDGFERYRYSGAYLYPARVPD